MRSRKLHERLLAKAVVAFNNRPCKCFGFGTPNEIRSETSGALSIGIKCPDREIQMIEFRVNQHTYYMNLV